MKPLSRSSKSIKVKPHTQPFKIVPHLQKKSVHKKRSLAPNLSQQQTTSMSDIDFSLTRQDFNPYDEDTKLPILTPASILAKTKLADLINPELLDPQLKINDKVTSEINKDRKKRHRDQVFSADIPIFMNAKDNNAEVDALLQELQREETKNRHVVSIINPPKTVISDILSAMEETGAQIIKERCLMKSMINRLFVFFRSAEDKELFYLQYNPASGLGHIEHADPKYNPTDEEIHTCITYILNGINSHATKEDIIEMAKDHDAANVIFIDKNPTFIRAAFNSREKATNFEEKANKGEIKLKGSVISAKYHAWGDERTLTLFIGYSKDPLASKEQFWRIILKGANITGINRIAPAINRETNSPLGYAFINFENFEAMDNAFFTPIFHNSARLIFREPKKAGTTTVCYISTHTSLHIATTITDKPTQLNTLYITTYLYTQQQAKRRQTDERESEWRRQQLSNPIPVSKPRPLPPPPTVSSTTTTTQSSTPTKSAQQAHPKQNK